MGLLSSISAGLRPRAAVTTRDDPSRYFYSLPMPQAVAGITLTTEEAMQLSVVWACGSAIVKAIAPSQWNVFGVENGKRTLLPDDPVEWLLNHEPNPESTAVAVREALLYAAVFSGNGYAEIVKSAGGRTQQIWPLVSNRVVPRRTPMDPEDPEAGWQLVYDYYQPLGGIVRLRPDQVLHLRGPSIDGLMGDHAVARAAHAIGLAVAQERFASSYFANGTQVGAILEFPGTLEKETRDALRQDWADKHGGPERAYKPVVLEGGMKLSSTKIGNTPAEASLVDQRKFSVEDICRFFGVPLHKVQHLAGSQGYGTNIEQLGIEFVRDGLTPWTTRIEQEADRKLFKARAPWRSTKLDTAWLTQGDSKTRADAAKVWIEAGVKTVNEIRHLEGQDGIGKSGDVHFLSGTLKPIDQVISPPAPPAPPAGPPPAPTEEPAEDPAEEGEGAGEQDDQEGAGKKPAAELLREAVLSLLTSSLDRYGRRMVNRAADLRRGGRRTETQVAVALAEAREDARPRLLEECREALGLLAQALPSDLSRADAILTLAADEVDNGGSPAAEANRVVDQVVKESAT